MLAGLLLALPAAADPWWLPVVRIFWSGAHTAAAPHAHACTADAHCYPQARRLCVLGNCACRPRSSGAGCSEWPICAALLAAASCGAGGRCVAGRCLCRHGAAGEFCEASAAEADAVAQLLGCSGHGRVLAAHRACVCAAGFGGAHCDSLATPLRRCAAHWCSGRGECLASGVCRCDGGFSGSSCARADALCSHSCGHGRCGADGACHCDAGWSGADCSLPAAAPPAGCAHGCSGRGLCSAQGFARLAVPQ